MIIIKMYIRCTNSYITGIMNDPYDDYYPDHLVNGKTVFNVKKIVYLRYQIGQKIQEKLIN